MGHRRLPKIAAAATAAICLGFVLSGCGSSGGTSNAVDLTKRLAPDAPSYRVVDFTTLRVDLGLPEDADPLTGDLAVLASPALGSLPAVTGMPIAATLDLGRATAAATATERESVTVLSTEADTGDIGSALGDLGFVDRGGVLEEVEQPEPSERPAPAPAIRLEEGLIFIAEDPALLRDLPADPLDDLPAELLGDLGDAPVIVTIEVDACVRATGMTAEADGSGELAFLVDGGADAERLSPADEQGLEFGEAEVDGDLITIPVSSVDGGYAAMDAAMGLLTSYDCG